MKHWADGGETSLRVTLPLCRRHHRTVHEGRVKVSVNRDGTVLFFTRRGRVLADAPKTPTWAKAPNRRVRASAPKGRELEDAPKERERAEAPERRVRAGSRVSPQSLPPVQSAHPGARSMGERPTLSSGAALYNDLAIPWEIEAAAREAVEESLEA